MHKIYIFFSVFCREAVIVQSTEQRFKDLATQNEPDVIIDMMNAISTKIAEKEELKKENAVLCNNWKTRCCQLMR